MEFTAYNNDVLIDVGDDHFVSATRKRVTHQLEMSHEVLGDLLGMLTVYKLDIGDKLPNGMNPKQLRIYNGLVDLFERGSR